MDLAQSRRKVAYDMCQPLQYQTIYTPGVCPEEYGLHSIVALRFPGNDSITE
jgi:hypothetical protein